jgi:hypothetical protein
MQCDEAEGRKNFLRIPCGGYLFVKLVFLESSMQQSRQCMFKSHAVPGCLPSACRLKCITPSRLCQEACLSRHTQRDRHRQPR